MFYKLEKFGFRGKKLEFNITKYLKYEVFPKTLLTQAEDY